MLNQTVCFLIDNDEDDREIFEMALLEAAPGVSFTASANGVEALRRLNADPEFLPSVIFVDMNMPMMNGHQCLLALKQIERLKDIPVYIFSTSADPSLVREVLSGGAADYISKPSGFTALIELLSRLIPTKPATL